MNERFLQIQTRFLCFLKTSEFSQLSIEKLLRKHDGNYIRIDECKRRAAVK